MERKDRGGNLRGRNGGSTGFLLEREDKGGDLGGKRIS